MAWVAVAVAGTSLIGGMMQADAAGDAAATQAGSAREGIAEQRRQFDALQKLLAPYAGAGTDALSAQRDLIGLNGAGPQQQAIGGLETSPMFTALTRQGERGILANASATGGLRGGNTQAALAEFRPALLAQLIEQQYGRLGGLTSVGQNAAAGVGNAGMQTGNNVANLMQQQGAAVAGGQMARGQAWGGLGQAAGLFAGLGGFGRINTPTADLGMGSYGDLGGVNFGIGGPGF